MESLTLLKCHFQIINKAADPEKPQLGGVKPRNLKMSMGMNIDEGEIINLSDYAQKDGWIKSPCNAHNKLSKDQKREMRGTIQK